METDSGLDLALATLTDNASVVADAEHCSDCSGNGVWEHGACETCNGTGEESALSILWSCGLLPSRYDTIEKAAAGVREIVRSLRNDLRNPPADVQERVLHMHGHLGASTLSGG